MMVKLSISSSGYNEFRISCLIEQKKSQTIFFESDENEDQDHKNLQGSTS